MLASKENLQNKNAAWVMITKGLDGFVMTITEQNKADLTRCAEEILLAREVYFLATIADLYDPEPMPSDLRDAHERNDETLERIYMGRRFKNDHGAAGKTLRTLYQNDCQSVGRAPDQAKGAVIVFREDALASHEITYLRNKYFYSSPIHIKRGCFSEESKNEQ